MEKRDKMIIGKSLNSCSLDSVIEFLIVACSRFNLDTSGLDLTKLNKEESTFEKLKEKEKNKRLRPYVKTFIEQGCHTLIPFMKQYGAKFDFKVEDEYTGIK